MALATWKERAKWVAIHPILLLSLPKGLLETRKKMMRLELNTMNSMYEDNSEKQLEELVSVFKAKVWLGSSKGLRLKPVSLGSRKVTVAGSSTSVWARNFQASSPFTST